MNSEGYYYHRPLSLEETKKYYQDLIEECQKKLTILDTQIALLSKKKNPVEVKVRKTYIDAREKNRKIIAACRIYIFGLDKSRTVVPPPPPPPPPPKENTGKEGVKGEGKTKPSSGKKSTFNPLYRPPPYQKTGFTGRNRAGENVITGKETFVNRKQYHRILKRRESREKLQKMLAMYTREVETGGYNRSEHAKNRPRGRKGQWIMSEESEEKLLSSLTLNRKVITRSCTTAEKKKKKEEELARKSAVLMGKAKHDELPSQQQNNNKKKKSTPSPTSMNNNNTTKTTTIEKVVKKSLPPAEKSGIKKSEKTVTKDVIEID